MQLRGEVVVNRPVDEVFDFVADETNEPLYNPAMRSVERVSAGPIGVGTRFMGRIATAGRLHGMEVEYTEFDRPRRLASSAHMASMDVRGSLQFDPVPGGTRLRWTWYADLHGAARLLSPLAGRFERRNWERLKRHLEQTGAPAAGAAPADAPTPATPYAAWLAGWAGAAVLAVANGAARDALLTPRLGKDRAQQVSSLSLVTLLAAYGTALQRRRPIPTTGGALRVGVAWVALTLLFESGLGRIQGLSWRAILDAYDVRRGRTWGLVVVWIGAVPVLSRRPG